MADSGCLRVSQILVNKASGDSVLQVLENRARKNCQIVPVYPCTGSQKCPDPPILAFFCFPRFFRFAVFLAFLCVSRFFSRDFRGSAGREILAFFGASLLFCQKSKDWRVRVVPFIWTPYTKMPLGVPRKLRTPSKLWGCIKQ